MVERRGLNILCVSSVSAPQPKLCYAILFYSILFYSSPVHSSPFSFFPFHLIPSYPISSHSIPSHSILFSPTLSYSTPSHSTLSYAILPYPIPWIMCHPCCLSFHISIPSWLFSPSLLILIATASDSSVNTQQSACIHSAALFLLVPSFGSGPLWPSSLSPCTVGLSG